MKLLKVDLPNTKRRISLSETEEKKPPFSKEQLDNLAELEFKSELISSDKIYVDLSLFKDLYIGALLSFIHNPGLYQLPLSNQQEAYLYIMTNLREYRKRIFNDTAYYFPKLNISNEMIEQRLRDHEYSSIILKLAPITDFIKVFKTQISVNVNNSSVMKKRTPNGKIADIFVTINTYPLKLDKGLEMYTGVYFAEEFKVATRTVYLEPTKMHINHILTYDEFYIYHLNEFFKTPYVTASFKDIKFMQKYVFTPKFFGYIYKTNYDHSRDAKQSSAWMNMLCKFKYIELPFVTASLPNQEEMVQTKLEEIYNEYNTDKESKET
jgi:hypothetical protein